MQMTIDLETIRSQFPALSIVDGDMPRIYFDNPGGTQAPTMVADRMQQCLLESNANIQGGFRTSNLVDAIIEDAHQAVADLLNAPSRDEIVYGANMTTLTLHLSRSIGRCFNRGDEIILSRMCHDANVGPWLMLARDLGLEVKWMPFNTETFEFDLDQYDDLLTNKTELVCVGGASNMTGTINDIKSICARANAAGAWTYIDAVQSVPNLVLLVAVSGQDMGRKLIYLTGAEIDTFSIVEIARFSPDGPVPAGARRGGGSQSIKEGLGDLLMAGEIVQQRFSKLFSLL